MKNRISYWIITLLLYVGMVSPAQAVVVPSFPACTSPQGTEKVSYSDGTHGIVGSTAEYIGSDTVYTVTDSTLMQCFCPKDGATGVQSNWWKASNLSESDIQILKNDGWNYVPNGSLWGLEDTPYVVKNNEYACKASSGIGGGEILATAATTDVLGLAATGDSILILGTGVSGLAFLLLGIYVYNSTRKK